MKKNFSLVILDNLLYPQIFNSLEKILTILGPNKMGSTRSDKKLINKILDEHLPNYIFSFSNYVDNSIFQPHYSY